MKIEMIDVDQLLLDPNNHRFAELYSGSDKESDLIEYLLYTEAAEEVAKNISVRGYFYPDEALWVTPKGGKFLVKDGNRRCAAVKALQNPEKYGLNFSNLSIKQLPVLVYEDEKELDRRIQEQHTHSLFREWGRIAKALKAFEMRQSGSSEEVIREIDSNPPQLIKLASFYFEAVKIAGEDLKKLLRRGKGETGGKTIIFERLFSYSRLCGYHFKNKPAYLLEILDEEQFNSYVSAIVAYLVKNPSTKHQQVDKEEEGFLEHLKDFGFTLKTSVPNVEKKKDDEASKTPLPPPKRGTIKTRPVYERKQVAPKLKRLIDECYNLGDTDFANAKVALARVTFESVLKYVIEETKHGNKKLSSFSHFQNAYFKNGKKLEYTNFTVLKNKFIELIINTGKRKAFNEFNLEKLHQIIHNYNVGAAPHDARTTAENLIPLVEFMLQEQADLLSSLDQSKLT
jgi:hypothetical protein